MRSGVTDFSLEGRSDGADGFQAFVRHGSGERPPYDRSAALDQRSPADRSPRISLDQGGLARARRRSLEIKDELLAHIRNAFTGIRRMRRGRL
jgi:hypothetical protein